MEIPPALPGVISLGTSSNTNPGRVAHVEVAGREMKVKWTQTADGLHVELPKRYEPRVDYATALKVTLT